MRTNGDYQSWIQKHHQLSSNPRFSEGVGSSFVLCLSEGCRRTVSGWSSLGDTGTLMPVCHFIPGFSGCKNSPRTLRVAWRSVCVIWTLFLGDEKCLLQRVHSLSIAKYGQETFSEREVGRLLITIEIGQSGRQDPGLTPLFPSHRGIGSTR